MATRHVKVVVLTIVATAEAEERAKQLGAADYIVKTELKLHELVERIIAHLCMRLLDIRFLGL